MQCFERVSSIRNSKLTMEALSLNFNLLELKISSRLPTTGNRLGEDMQCDSLSVARWRGKKFDGAKEVQISAFLVLANEILRKQPQPLKASREGSLNVLKKKRNMWLKELRKISLEELFRRKGMMGKDVDLIQVKE